MATYTQIILQVEAVNQNANFGFSTYFKASSSILVKRFAEGKMA